MPSVHTWKFARAVFAVFLYGFVGCENGQVKSAAGQSVGKPGILLALSDTASFERVTFKTLDTHISPRDHFRPGPPTKIVLADSRFFAEAWRLIGAQGAPPDVDFSKNTVILIATDTYGGGNMEVAVDSVFKSGTRLYVIVQEFSNGLLTDEGSRSTIALLIPGVFGDPSVTFIGRQIVNRFPK